VIAVIDDDVEIRRALKNPPADIMSIGLADDDANGRIIESEVSAIRIDVAAYQD